MKGASRNGLGHDFLKGAGKHFQDTWEYGLDKVRECVKSLQAALDQTQQNYGGTEQGIAKGFSPESH